MYLHISILSYSVTPSVPVWIDKPLAVGRNVGTPVTACRLLLPVSIYQLPDIILDPLVVMAQDHDKNLDDITPVRLTLYPVKEQVIANLLT